MDLGGVLTKVIVFGLTLGYSRRNHYTVSLDETQASILGRRHHLRENPRYGP